MNETIRNLHTHRSYRNFDPDHRLPEAELQEILKASRQAPSWMNGQAYSIMVIDDRKLQQELAELVPGNAQIGSCSVFLLYLLDLRRMETAAEIQKAPYAVTGDLDALLVTATDTSLAMENALVAAESLGYGTVCIGSVRKVTAELIDKFGFPAYVYPFCGLCIGRPTVAMKIKPRLPQSCVVFRNGYHDESFREDLLAYDRTMKEFAEARETKLWTKKFADHHSTISNPQTNSQLRRQRFIE